MLVSSIPSARVSGFPRAHLHGGVGREAQIRPSSTASAFGIRRGIRGGWMRRLEARIQTGLRHPHLDFGEVFAVGREGLKA
ncbi:hypothetical protein GQ55_4G258300 [Panicum hallii var. hallii]|uniref:Uncharacterized protein n=1 Tax=Panicum hallii var. hallii TaxID=1504633 RepID=A0A2T7E053_9POAL|nr:hypothetical protein GQ55_4G258300 [Panicum hallii var. hallii]